MIDDPEINLHVSLNNLRDLIRRLQGKIATHEQVVAAYEKYLVCRKALDEFKTIN